MRCSDCSEEVLEEEEEEEVLDVLDVLEPSKEEEMQCVPQVVWLTSLRQEGSTSMEAPKLGK